jgi:hypothetical protein
MVLFRGVIASMSDDNQSARSLVDDRRAGGTGSSRDRERHRWRVRPGPVGAVRVEPSPRGPQAGRWSRRGCRRPLVVGEVQGLAELERLALRGPRAGRRGRGWAQAGTVVLGPLAGITEEGVGARSGDEPLWPVGLAVDIGGDSDGQAVGMREVCPCSTRLGRHLVRRTGRPGRRQSSPAIAVCIAHVVPLAQRLGDRIHCQRARKETSSSREEHSPEAHTSDSRRATQARARARPASGTRDRVCPIGVARCRADRAAPPARVATTSSMAATGFQSRERCAIANIDAWVSGPRQ